MGKGRKCAPSVEPDGAWFVHRGCESAGIERTCDTSTGSMLMAPFAGPVKPAPPPEPFRAKTMANNDRISHLMELLDRSPSMSYFIRERSNVRNGRRRPGMNEINYKISNVFSEHDNRHSFQDHGVYFGNGRDQRTLGKRLMLPDLRLHHTDNVYLKHNDRVPVNFDLNTSYNLTYEGKPTEQPPVHRRFPKRYNPTKGGQMKLDTKTTDWYQPPDVPHRTATQVLATSQEPFLKHNPWKYSYHGMRNIYPSYKRNSQPIVPNEFNKYGAAYVAGS